jgi:hypothetical protein
VIDRALTHSEYVQTSRLRVRCQSALQAIFLRASVLFVASGPMSGFVLTPVAVLAGVLGAWRLGADPGAYQNRGLPALAPQDTQP